ncbi:MAG: DUF3810 domain-containing protein [Clostridia bacterium]|nr:DUF3810 domain-containing protein [Clostridia bacterium]
MKKWFCKLKNKIKEYVPTAARVLFCIALFALIVHVLCIFIPPFADFFNFRIAGVVRLVLAKITGVVPFSISELVVLLVLPAIVFILVFTFRESKKGNDRKLIRFLSGAFAVLSLFYTLFVFTLGTGYHGTSLSDKLDLERKELTTDELIEVTEWLVSKVNEYVPKVDFIHDSSSVMPYSFKEMNEKLCEAYASATKDYDFIMGYSSVIKPVMASKFLSKAGLLGMYSYYTGESNVNVDYMNYNLVFTCAHEMSHQRGISKEDEANFMAFLVCMESDDPYINYCGYLNMFEYMRNPLYEALIKENRASYYTRVRDKLDERARNDVNISDKKTVDNQGTISTIYNAINDTFIKTQLDERGSASYGFVIELTAAYYYKYVKPAA